MSVLKADFTIKVMHSDDRVRVLFEFPVAWVELDRNKAAELAALIAAHAHEPLKRPARGSALQQIGKPDPPALPEVPK